MHITYMYITCNYDLVHYTTPDRISPSLLFLMLSLFPQMLSFLLLAGVDLQTCGLSSLSGQAFLDMLPTNSSLMVVDLRDNASIGTCRL